MDVGDMRSLSTTTSNLRWDSGEFDDFLWNFNEAFFSLESKIQIKKIR